MKSTNKQESYEAALTEAILVRERGFMGFGEIVDFSALTQTFAYFNKLTHFVMKLIEKELNTIESVFIVSHHADELGIPVDSEIKVIKNADGISQIQ